jgi:polysaccharide biosynthesis/export protein
MLYTIESVISISRGQPNLQTALPVEDVFRGTFMRTVILSALFAVISIAAPTQDPKPTSELAKSPQKPADPPLSVLCAPGTTIQLGVAYNSALIASGGSGSYQFAITGGALPAGVGLNPATGAISGTPTVDGTFSYTVQVTDSAGAIATTGSTPCTLQLALAPPSVPVTDPASKPPSDTASANKAPVVAPPAIDPATLAEPREKAAEKGAAPASPDDHPFILGAEDQISVLVYGSPEFSGPHMIRPDGKITMPFLGDVMASGVTPAELSNIIKDRLKKYIVDPDVSVSVSAVNSKRYYIQGEVGRTGGFPLLVPTKVLEALVNAGGFKDFANQKDIIVMRVSGERLKFNYKEVIKGKKMDQNIYLKPGDIIIVR